MVPTKDSIEFGKRLLELRNSRGLSQTDVAKALRIGQTTYAGYETGKRNATVSVINKFATFFNVSPDYLLGVNGTNKFIIPKHYDNLSDSQKKVAYRIFNEAVKALYEQQFITSSPLSTEKQSDDNVIDISTRQLPLYLTSASAGLGQYIDNSDYKLIDVGPECPPQANFILRVQGDSMEPKFYNGDLLYIKQQPQVEDGEIGIFYLDGNVYVKRQEHRNGKCYLISLNPAYAPIEIGEYSSCTCYGKVLN